MKQVVASQQVARCLRRPPASPTERSACRHHRRIHLLCLAPRICDSSARTTSRWRCRRRLALSPRPTSRGGLCLWLICHAVGCRHWCRACTHHCALGLFHFLFLHDEASHNFTAGGVCAAVISKPRFRACRHRRVGQRRLPTSACPASLHCLDGYSGSHLLCHTAVGSERLRTRLRGTSVSLPSAGPASLHRLNCHSSACLR